MGKYMELQDRTEEGGVRAVVDIILLLMCGIVIAARCQISETFLTESTGLNSEGAGEIGYAGVTASLVFSGVILLGAVLWLLVRMGRGAVEWRSTSLVGPMVAMTAAGIISTAYASNKHAAAVGAVNLLSQFVLAILLVQLLNRLWKQRLFLGILAAAGVVMAYRCWELYYFELGELVSIYEQNPEGLLLARGLEPGSFAAAQFVNRLLSRDVGGYFLISNTAAAFFVLSIMATLAIFTAPAGPKTSARRQYLSLGVGILILIQVGGLIITQSKGGIGSWVAAAIFMGVLWWGRQYFRRYWRTTIAAMLVLGGLALAAMVGHGIYHGRLPTLSMWVRWQYWQAGWSIITEHWFTGVGAENFGTYYRQYMTAAAPEVVKDPHSLPLALWSQWGVLGLIGFIWAGVGIAIQLARPKPVELSERIFSGEKDDTLGYWWAIGLLVIISVILIRWAVSEMGRLSAVELSSILLIIFLIPSVFWLGAFYLTQALINSREQSTADRGEVKMQTIVPLVLGSGLLGFILHNSIDFAIFQPGAGTFFFAMMGLALAARHGEALTTAPNGPSLKGKTRGAMMVVVLFIFAGWLVLMVRVGKAEYLMERANQEPYAADTLTKEAAEANPWDPNPCYWAGWLWQWEWFESGMKDMQSYDQALSWLEQAAERDPANHIYYVQMSKHTLAAAEQAADEQKRDLAEKAWRYVQEALERYPTNSELLLGAGQLLVDYGDIMEIGGWRQEALVLFEKALASEQAFEEQQRQMYPQWREITPRLSRDYQERAREQIQKLREALDKGATGR